MTPLHALPQPLLTREEMAREMRVSLRTFDEMRKDGKRSGLPCPEVTWGRRMVRFRPAEVWAWGTELQRMKEAA